jgi:hypothetical protein
MAPPTGRQLPHRASQGPLQQRRDGQRHARALRPPRGPRRLHPPRLLPGLSVIKLFTDVIYECS